MRPSPQSFVRRLTLLFLCIAVGAAVGFIGQSLTSRSEWFLAVPVCVAVGWLFLADPTQCLGPKK